MHERRLLVLLGNFITLVLYNFTKLHSLIGMRSHVRDNYVEKLLNDQRKDSDLKDKRNIAHNATYICSMER
jgi:hypothetical protein